MLTKVRLDSLTNTTQPLFNSLSIVVLVGEMGAGKSNILQRYNKNVFTRISNTIGSDFLIKKTILTDQPG